MVQKKRKNKKSMIDTSKKKDFLIPILIFCLSLLVPLIIAFTRYFLIEIPDDIWWISWAQNNHYDLINIMTTKIGNGWRPMDNIWYTFGYTIGRVEPFYYYLINGVLFAGSMVYLYKIGKILHSNAAGIIAVTVYLFLDASYIIISKIAYISSISEIFFMVLSIYFAIRYYKFNEKNSMYLGIIFSILSFLSKETSVVIIPAVNLAYIFYTRSWTKKRILINIIPFLFLAINVLILSPEMGNKGIGASAINNIFYYINDEIQAQFKSYILLIIVIFISIYYYYNNILRKEIAISCVWFVFGFIPLILTSIEPMPLYTAEPNLGMVLLIGIIVSETWSKKNKFISFILLIALIIQILYVPTQVTAMENYYVFMTNEQKSFREITDYIKQEIPYNSSLYYIPNEIRNKYKISQIDENTFQTFLCMQGRCDIKVTDYKDAEYTVLIDSADVYLFVKEVNNNKNPIILKNIKNGDALAYLIKN